MSEYIQPVLIALAVLLIPACARWAVATVVRRMDEGRIVGAANAAEIKRVAVDQAAKVANLLEEHRTELMGDIGEIMAQTTRINGKVAELDGRMIAAEAKTELLTEIYTRQQAP